MRFVDQKCWWIVALIFGLYLVGFFLVIHNVLTGLFDFHQSRICQDVAKVVMPNLRRLNATNPVT